VKWPCFYGIDFATRAELVANALDTDGVRRSIGADSLGYVSLGGLVQATEQPTTRMCRACFDGAYPIELPPDNAVGKHVLEGVGRRVQPGATDPQDPRGSQHEEAVLYPGPGGYASPASAAAQRP
jgi:amidophosphoribosyltransferase